MTSETARQPSFLYYRFDRRQILFAVGLGVVAFLLVLIAIIVIFLKNNEAALLRMNQQLLQQVDILEGQLSEKTAATTSASSCLTECARVADNICENDIVNLGTATYLLPCGWHSYFELRFTDPVEQSFGYADDRPIQWILATESPPAKVNIRMNYFSETLSNSAEDPLTDILDQKEAQGAKIEDIDNLHSVKFKKVTSELEPVGEVVSYYSQFRKDGDVYVVIFENYKSEDYAHQLMDTFEWDVD